MSQRSSGFIFASCASPDSKNHSSPRCDRRQFLITTTLSTFSLCGSTRAEPVSGRLESDSGLQNFGTLKDIESVVSDTVTLDAFITDLNKGSVRQVWFFGFQNQNCFYSRSDGSIIQIGEGYPKESARSSESPLQIMAQVRNR